MINHEPFNEKELIKTLQAPDCSKEQADYIWALLWQHYLPYIEKQAHLYFSRSLFFDYDEIMQECFLTFRDVVLKYDSSKSALTTALFLPLKHTFTNYIAFQNGFTLHENRMAYNFATVLQHYNANPNDSIEVLTDMYNTLFPRETVTSRSLAKYREYYFSINKIYLDQYDEHIPSADYSPEQEICNKDFKEKLHCCIQLAPEKDRPFLLFLFGFHNSVTIDNHLYLRGQNPHPIGPLRKAGEQCLQTFTTILYKNAMLEKDSAEAFKTFLYNYSAS